MAAKSMLSLIVLSEEQLVQSGIREHEAFLYHTMRNPGGTGRGDVSMDGEWQGHKALKGVGVRGSRLPSPPCFFFGIYICMSASVSIWKVASEYLFYTPIYLNSCLFHIYFILFIFFSKTYYLIFHLYILNFVISRDIWV